MAAKKRLSKIENKFNNLEDLEKLQLRDVFCPICQSILIEPVKLPCTHVFCRRCFDGSIEHNALCCPLCRLRIGSWLRTASKQKNLVNTELWNHIKNKFSSELDKKLKGEDITLSPEKPHLRLSAPGEIRMEYEAELQRLKLERTRIERKHIHETEQLIRKLQEEEDTAHKKYIDTIKQDELLALKLQDRSLRLPVRRTSPKKLSPGRALLTKPKFKPVKIDNFLSKISVPVPKYSPLITDDDTSTDSSINVPLSVVAQQASLEIIPSYSKTQNNIEKIPKNTNVTNHIWDKENGKSKIVKEPEPQLSQKLKPGTQETSRDKKTLINSLPVSLPLPSTGILQHKSNVENRSMDNSSVDSVRLELCFFKPIDGTSPTSNSISKSLPLKVPGIHAKKCPSITPFEPPSRSQYLEGLCRLRKISLGQNLPSAFVLALNLLRVKKESTPKCETYTQSKINKTAGSSQPGKKNVSNKNKSKINEDGITKLEEPFLKRTRSMGSLNKDENTPKKVKVDERKVSSERKSCLRSSSKKSNMTIVEHGSPLDIEATNNNKVIMAVKNLSSPLKNCEVKNIVHEQIKIEKMIDQEKRDYDLACKIDAEWNGRRQPRRNTVKRQVTINYALRPAKKLKV